MSSSRELLITIDGPAGAGKSTAAEMLAQRLGYTHVSTGDIYRAVACLSLERDVDRGNEEAIVDLVAGSELEFRSRGGRARVFAAGKDLSERLRSEEVAAAASTLSAHPRVREALLAVQRRTAQWGGVVADGRDVGTVVFPDAEIKFYLDASVEARARRRYLELKGKKKDLDPFRVREEMVQRDRNDRRRAAAPLRVPADAVIVDTTALTPGEVVNGMMEVVSSYRLAHSRG